MCQATTSSRPKPSSLPVDAMKEPSATKLGSLSADTVDEAAAAANKGKYKLPTTMLYGMLRTSELLTAELSSHYCTCLLHSLDRLETRTGTA